jgi:hypothetical protein
MQNAPKTHMTDATDGRIDFASGIHSAYCGRVNFYSNDFNGIVSHSASKSQLIAAGRD